jgi:hypothetical protein
LGFDAAAAASARADATIRSFFWSCALEDGCGCGGAGLEATGGAFMVDETDFAATEEPFFLFRVLSCARGEDAFFMVAVVVVVEEEATEVGDLLGVVLVVVVVVVVAGLVVVASSGEKAAPALLVCFTVLIGGAFVEGDVVVIKGIAAAVVAAALQLAEFLRACRRGVVDVDVEDIIIAGSFVVVVVATNRSVGLSNRLGALTLLKAPLPPERIPSGRRRGVGEAATTLSPPVMVLLGMVFLLVLLLVLLLLVV